MGGSDDAPAGGAAAEEPIFELAIDCGRQFEKALKTEATTESAHSGRLIGEYQRLFWKWSQYVGVFAAGKASLDWRLRHNNEYRDLFLLALDMLRVNLRQLLPLDARSVDSGDSDLSDDSDPRGVAFEGIEEAIAQLNNLGISIRQPSTSRLESKVKAFAAKRVVQLNDFEMLALLAVQRLYPDAAPSLHRRLSRHMVDTHMRLLYWKSHKEKLEADRGGHSRQDPQPKPKPLRIVSNPEPSIHKLLGETGERPAPVALSETEATTVPSHAPAPIQRQHGNVKETRHGAPTTVLNTPVKFPPPPKAEDGNKCWYCLKVHLAEEYEDGTWWKNHVNGDLLPYICLFDFCLGPKAFQNSGNWAQHMISEHGNDWALNIPDSPVWRCGHGGGGHDATLYFATLGHLKDHCGTAHINDRGLERIDRDIMSNQPPVVCPFCHRTFQDSKTKGDAQSAAKDEDGNPGRSLRVAPTDKKVKWAMDVKQAPPEKQDGLGDQKHPRINRDLSSHIAEHLQRLALLTVRLKDVSSDGGDDSVSRSCRTSNAMDEQMTGRSRSTINDLAADKADTRDWEAAGPESVPQADALAGIDATDSTAGSNKDNATILSSLALKGLATLDPSARLRSWVNDDAPGNKVNMESTPHLPQRDESSTASKSLFAHTGGGLEDESLETLIDEFDIACSKSLQTSEWGQAAEKPMQFLSFRDLDTVVNRSLVERVVRRLPGCKDHAQTMKDILSPVSLPSLQIDGKQQRIGLNTRRRVFLLVFLARKPEKILDLIGEGVTDNDLPFTWTSNTRAPRRRGSQESPGREVQCLSTEKDTVHSTFSLWQWRTLSPFLRLSTKEKPKVSHYLLDMQTPLPFIKVSSTGPTYGAMAFPMVHKVAIEPSHFNHDSFKPRPGAEHPLFTVKTLNPYTKRETFEHEVDAIKKMMTEGGLHRSLVRLLATIEKDGQYHMIFPWADADLYEYWVTLYPGRDDLPRGHDLARWMAWEFLGLAEAIKRVHDSRVSAGNPQDVEQTRKVYGCQGGVMPESILFFEGDDQSGGPGKLQLAEFGSARPYSSPYQSPEFDTDVAVGPKTDIWSFGAVALVFIAWYCEGRSAVESFAGERMDDDRMDDDRIEGGRFNDDITLWLPRFPEDKFFNRYQGGSVAKASVLGKIESLRVHPRCSQYVRDFLDYIESHLLVVNEDQRASSAETCAKLAIMFEKCKGDPAYCTGKGP
ncbi:hypothetical protein MAPG_08399 [Magnaporthiopsis poae ATCC 64411]|uniref:Protein kinase domain-containing protein n=1 Tax=Magnaporthiopsis poae (strain ATCC 64411 / 73-15) TaxID=644358 RepID=A0A0C4E795_MAGP6|nr:hypothetical protein MAPG_08399 [Magnaporthiopsis poae ATCC 64411]